MKIQSDNLRLTASLVMAAIVLAEPSLQASHWAKIPRDSAAFDEQLLNGLRQRRLFSLAETHCRARLSDQSLRESARADLTVELIRIRSARAVNALPADRDSFWANAHEAAEQFLITGDRPRRILVQIQQALTHLAHGQLTRQEAEVGAVIDDANERALTQLRLADRQLTEIDKQLTREIPQRRRQTDEDHLTADELFALQNNVRYHLARVYRNRGLCYPPESADRVDALTRAIEQHRSLANRLPDDAPLRWEIHIESASCYRMLNRYDDARRHLAKLSEANPDPALELRGRAEAVRLELAGNRHQQALKLLGQGRTLQGRAAPDLDLAHVEAFTTLAMAADNATAADAWQKKAVTAAQRMDRLHGPYWARRANILLVRSASKSGTRDLETLIRVADNLYVNGQLDQAVVTYTTAARQAAADGNADQQFRMYYQAALVEHQRQNHSAANRRFRDLALELPADNRAASAHLLAAWNASQIASRNNEAWNDYADLLEEHLANWPSSPTANQARQWLGRLRERQGSWKEALDLYLEVDRDSDRFAESVQAAADCSTRYLAQLNNEKQSDSQRAESLAERFEDLFLKDGQPAHPWDNAKRTAVIAAARIRLQFLPDDYRAAAEILETAQQEASSAPDAWRTTVQSLLVVALAGQPDRRADASKILDSLAKSSPELLLEMLEGLAGIARKAHPQARAEIGRLQLESIRKLTAASPPLDASSKLRLQQIQAAALATVGQKQEALTQYAQLAREAPRHAEIQEEYAQLLLDTESPDQLQSALVQWRSIDRMSRPHSPRWYRAKYSIALAHFRLGQTERTAQLIQYLQATPPGLQNVSLKPQFDELLRRCATDQ